MADDNEDTAPEREEGGPPLYMQVASTLRTAIVRGIYPVGSRIPTEEELCARFMVSRHTVREALRRLRADGLISSRQGGRPIVVPPSARGAVRRFSAEMGKDFYDYTMGTRLAIESMEMTTVNKTLGARFDVPMGEQWLRVRGFREAGEEGKATCWHDYLIAAEFSAVGRLLHRHVGPFLPLIEDLFSERVVKVAQAMSAVAMPGELAERFGMSAGDPALRIFTRATTAQGALALLSISLHPGGSVGYSVQLEDRDSPAAA